MSDRQEAKRATNGAIRSEQVIHRVEFAVPGSDTRVSKTYRLRAPTLGKLLDSEFPERRHLLSPWLRQQETAMVYAETGVGKSMFAASVALAVAGGGEFLGWRPKLREGERGYRVLYVDGEMHIQDIQDRMRVLIKAVPGVDLEAARGTSRSLRGSTRSLGRSSHRSPIRAGCSST
ncbi:AAA family ATPase [Fodinicurvata halophila]|uniref:AAA family ATPase n=1 Tax=Fodinicurvata halophila TaxID=1419723 RepID=UPI003636B24D